MREPNAPVPMSLPKSPAPRSARGPIVFLVGCALFVVLAVGGIIALAIAGQSVSVDDRAVLKMTLSGSIPEFVRTSGFDELFGQKAVTIHQHVMNLKKAAVDKRVKGVVIVLDWPQLGWAKVEELRDALTEFKKSGKFAIVYSEAMSEKEYALALGADEIVMPPESRFEFDGLAVDLAHYPGLLEKAGIEVQYFRFGKYKSASGQQLGLKAFTEPVREMINDELQGVFKRFVSAVAQARKLDEQTVNSLIDEGGSKVEWALEHHLVDKIMYWDEVEAEVRAKAGLKTHEKIQWLFASKYRDLDPDDAGLAKGQHTFALIYSVGLIVAGKGGGASPFGGGDTQGSDSIIRALREAADDDDVEAIVFRVDSPGGSGLGCDYVRREIERARQKKPVVVSMSDVAASGGYWVSMNASAIVAQPSTYTGSIGIFSVVPNLGGLYDKLGLNNETFKVGVHADALIGARRMSDDEAKKFDDDLRASYVRFVELAAKGRGKTADELEAVAQGRTWLGTQALGNGLIDKLGGFDVAVAVAKEKAHIPEHETVSLQLYDKKKSLLQELLRPNEEEDGSPELGALLLKQVVEHTAYGVLLRKVPGLDVFTQQVLAGQTLFPLMEYQIDLH